MNAKIADAQAAYRIATALWETLSAEVHEAYPCPKDPEAFDAWNDMIEDALDESGASDAAIARRDAQIDLLRICRDELQAYADRTGRPFARLAFDAALGDGHAYSFHAMTKTLDLCTRLDARTV